MEVDTSWISSPASSAAEEEMDQFVVEEIIIEEDGNLVTEQWTADETWASSTHDIGSPSLISCIDLTSDCSTVLSSSTQADSPSPSYILPHDSLTEEEDGLLDESFELMEDLISMKDNGAEWKHDCNDGETVAEKAQALLDHLDDYIKQEPFSDWLEEKTELPLLEELGNYVNYQRPVEMGLPAVPYQPRPVAVQTPHIGQIAPSLAQMVPGITLLNDAHVPLSAQIPPQQVEMSSPPRLDLTSPPQVASPPPPLTPALIREFETVLHQTLTPPHTPPTLLDLVSSQEEENKSNNLDVDIDTLIKSQLESLYEDKSSDKVAEWVPVSTQGSPAASDWGSASASNPTEDSDYSACLSSSESDTEWSPSVTRGHSGRTRRAVSSLEDRKVRKKEQNKNAATRYRLKKKAEQAGILGEEVTLVDQNTALKEKATELQREIKYLKSLMRDICKAKGLIS